MSHVIELAKRGNPSRKSNDLGKREFIHTDFKRGADNPSLNSIVRNFMLDYLPKVGCTLTGDDLDDLIKKRFDTTFELAKDYIKYEVVPIGSELPATWADTLNHQYHELIFERVVFFHGRESEVDLPIDGSPYQAVHDHYVPIHLFKALWGAKKFLMQAMNNRRKNISRNEDPVIEVFYYKKKRFLFINALINTIVSRMKQ